MSVNAFTSNQGTQSALLTDNTGGVNGTLIPILKISTDALGTFGTIWNGGVTGTINSGSIAVIAGTIASDTIVGGTLQNLATGTLNLVTTLSNLSAGSVNVIAGTISTLGTMGTLGLVNTVTTVTNLTNGTIQNSGTVTGVGVVTSLTQGSINVTAGTIATLGTMGTLGLVNTVTTVSNLSAGSVNVIAGTIATLGTMGTLGTALGVGVVTTVTNLSNGTIQNSGTVTGVGVISVLSLGTVVGTVTTNQASGTLNLGTVRTDARTTQNILTFGTNIANSGAAAATIVGSAAVGAGTSLWLQDVSVINPNTAAATVILGFGTTQQGTNVLFRGILGTNGAVGIEKPFAKAVNAGMTNQDLVFSTTGAGTVDLTISYFISA